MNQTTVQDEFILDVDHPNKLVIVKGIGRVNFNQAMEILNTVKENGEHQQGFNVFADLRAVEYHPSFDEIMQLKNQVTGLRKKLTGKIALLSEGRITILTEMVCAFANAASIKMKSFSVEEEAREWLNN